MSVVPFSTGAAPAPGTAPGSFATRLWTVIEVAPTDQHGQALKVRRATDLKAVVEGRILASQLMVFEDEERAIAEASALAADVPGRCFAAVEIVAFAFERGR